MFALDRARLLRDLTGYIRNFSNKLLDQIDEENCSMLVFLSTSNQRDASRNKKEKSINF